MKILGILQNQWFYPESLPRIRKMYEEAVTHELRAILNARFLFNGCQSGKNLRLTFGDLCNEIVWEEASLEKATRSSGAFKPDLIHLDTIIKYYRPSVVVTFGKPAKTGILAIYDGSFKHLVAPHPAARGFVLQDLQNVAIGLREYIDKCPLVEHDVDGIGDNNPA